MASDEDNFDIDVYGDIDEHQTNDHPIEVKHDSHMETSTVHFGNDGADDSTTVHQSELTGEVAESIEPNTKDEDFEIDVNGPISTTTEAKPPAETQVEAPKASPPRPKQGIKRKEGPDDRPMDHGATSAIFISDLHWWSTDDDIRGWINQTQCEDELKDITFSEHKVNGKSKGQAFVEFITPQAATAVKRKVETITDIQSPGKKFNVTYTAPTPNPYRTLPKDAPLRVNKDGPHPRHLENRPASGGGYNSPGGMSHSPNQGSMSFMNNFRGRGYNRGGPMNNMGGYQNRSFSGPMGGGGSPGGFQAGPGMGGYPAPTMGGMPPYGGAGGYPNRGGMMGGIRGGGPMGNRGGRGGMGGPNGMMPAGMPGMPGMGGMMGGMPSPMGANMGMGPMGMQGQPGGFQGPQPHFNPAFFNNQNQAAADTSGSWSNPHGTKRQRPE
ncbi:MAG: hypothetical protein M1816_008267 [Peltula sp. TS41687]|nr:MAG: hypothetical protein M1816_008267 [Peltula sp. TS41687]